MEEKGFEMEMKTEQTGEDTRREDEKEEEEDMPLLFTDGLPLDFQQNAQLAAIATFMADSDYEAGDDDESSTIDEQQQTTGKQQRQRTRRHQRHPYARSATDRPTDEQRPKSKSGDTTKELQLFMSLFKM